MTSVLQMDVQEILSAVEGEAAGGDARAGRILEVLLAEEAKTGSLSTISRLAASPHVPGDLRYERAKRAQENRRRDG